MTPEDKELCERLEDSIFTICKVASAAIKRLSAEKQSIRDELTSSNRALSRLADELTALRAQIADAQPVAWMSSGGVIETDYEDGPEIWLAHGGTASPLYLHPAADAKDAERYRWLRNGCDTKHSVASEIAANRYGMEWDAAIDAAMKGVE